MHIARVAGKMIEMYFIEPSNPIVRQKLQEIANQRFGDMVKAVVDLDRQVVALDAELHSDQEKELINRGSLQKNLWGINLYPDADDNDFVEFDSMINLRPSYGNFTRLVDDKKIQEQIITLIKLCIQ